MSTLKEMGEKVTEADVVEMIEEHDIEGNGYLNFEAFIRMMMAN
jgi:Ca2+-binding EF-hand superfamily protein